MKKVRRGRGGFSLVMTLFIGIILTGAALAILFRSSNEIQVSASQSGSVSALNSAESAGTAALQELLTRANSVSVPGDDARFVSTSTLSSNEFLPYLCKNAPDWILVKNSGGTYEAASEVSGTTGNAQKNYEEGFNPLLLGRDENLTGAAVITGNPAKLGLVGLTASCAGATNPVTKDAQNKITSVNFLPGTAAGGPGLSWTGPAEVDPISGDLIVSREKKIGSSGGNQVWGKAILKNFKLNVVEAIADASNQATGVFRLVYAFDMVAEGTIRTPAGTIIGRQIIQAPNILVVDVKQLTVQSSNFSQYALFIDDMDGRCFGTNQTYRGRAHVNRNLKFCGGAGTPTKFTGAFTTAVCGSSSTSTCPNGVLTTASGANFVGGVKFQEDDISYLDKPDVGSNQLKAALSGQLTPSANPSNDVLKNSEIRTQLGLKPSSEDAPPDGVYWANPTDKSSTSTAPISYSDWLRQATNKTTNPNNTEANLLSGLYIKGNVDYVNLYAAKSAAASSPDVQVVEIQQNTGGTTRRTKFTLDKSNDTTSVQVFTVNASTGAVSPEGAAATYSKAPNGVIFIDGNVGDNTKPCPANNKSSCRGVLSIPDDNTAAMGLSSGVTDTPSIQKDWGLTLAVNGDVAIQDNLDYQVDPRGNDRTFGTDDDPARAEAQNALGIVAFNTKQVKNANDSISSSTIDGTIYWGKGLADNVRRGRDPENTRDVDVIDLQASLYGHSQTFNPDNDRLAEYIQILGGEIRNKSRGDFQSCNEHQATTKVGSIKSYTCNGSRINLYGDNRFIDGTFAPPGFPKATQTSSGPFQYSVSAVGKQSIGAVRWQPLEYQ
jgi:hypothetical protein